MKKLDGKTALVTGGNSGIGYAAARELKEQGARVIITGRRIEAVSAAAKELSVNGIVADQADVTAIGNLATKVSSDFGKIDILFINAGVVEMSAIENATEKAFDYVMDINFKGSYFTLSKFIPVLNDGASVIFLSSNTASMNSAQSSIYSSSKAAVNSVMKIAAVELAPRHIRVNAISPGPHETEIMKKVGYNEEQLKGLNDWMIERIPLRKIGDASHIGKMVAYLSSDDATFVTGSEVIVDGGMSL